MRLILVSFGLVFVSGCAPATLYDWGNYEQAVYDYAKEPGEVDRYIASLDQIIANAEEANRVPPGMYAERGYALLSIGQKDAAMQDFARERDKWPESRKLMGLLIDGPPDEDGLSETALDSQNGTSESLSEELAEPSTEAEDSHPPAAVEQGPIPGNSRQ